MGLRIVAKDMGSMVVVTLQIVDADGVLTPSDVRDCVVGLHIRQLEDDRKGEFIVLYGRCPIWAYASLISPLMSLYPDWESVGIYDPRLGVVVVDSNQESRPVGTVLPFDLSQESLDSPGYVLYG